MPATNVSSSHSITITAAAAVESGLPALAGGGAVSAIDIRLGHNGPVANAQKNLPATEGFSRFLANLANQRRYAFSTTNPAGGTAAILNSVATNSRKAHNND
ncbi:hypothetical protein A5791_01415 [Mycobacterium sp. 852002-51163_SCH5372311]|uniref:hypothetical protein n=1 Tax=Mycobacterium sp. 852002-51163_SCH5372311 TaxID=1834097 RepID=UPI0008010F85|nr:hypothetical protein [Mycobacterium sp. 852002-51163_SCH5372311]OBF86134.1 hypothetical protein A5791_01415 [Mycobacterium sp. 852002-51163_SCH5372311]